MTNTNGSARDFYPPGAAHTSHEIAQEQELCGRRRVRLRRNDHLLLHERTVAGDDFNFVYN